MKRRISTTKCIPGPSPTLWDLEQDGSHDETDDVYNIFALELPLQISRDKSEMGSLRRIQEDECLELSKRRLFATKLNPTRYIAGVVED